MSMDSAHSKPASATPGCQSIPALPEPYKYRYERGEGLHDEQDTFTADQMRDYARRAQAAAMEQAAQRCEQFHHLGEVAIENAATAIRELAKATGAKP